MVEYKYEKTMRLSDGNFKQLIAVKKKHMRRYYASSKWLMSPNINVAGEIQSLHW